MLAIERHALATYLVYPKASFRSVVGINRAADICAISDPIKNAQNTKSTVSVPHAIIANIHQHY